MSEREARGQCADLTDDRRATPADIAACRIDFGNWLSQLRRFQRQVALRLAAGDTTAAAADYFRVSPGRISQMRRELWQDWHVFQGLAAAV